MVYSTLRGRVLSLVAAVGLCVSSAMALASSYEVDPAHSFVQFRIQHLGFSWLYGRFNGVSGEFTYDAENPDSSEIAVEIDTASIDTNHAERDKHLRGEDFLDVEKHPQASFKSTKFTPNGDGGGALEGELTLHGVTKPITLEIKKIGEGEDPWGGYRAGFIGTTNLTRKDFGMEYDLGPAGETMELELGIEGIRKE